MSRQRISVFASLLMAMTISASANAQSMGKFRGIERLQTNVQGENNLLASPTLDRMASNGGTPFFIDIYDDFNRSGPLAGSDADSWQNEFVPPVDGLPLGPLSGQNAENSGRWVGHNGFVVNNGRVSRISDDGPMVASVPWLVAPGLGDDYLLEMDAVVAVGERTALGYLGNIDLVGSAAGLNGELGQLVLGIERVDAQTLIWDVSWDLNGQRQQFTSQVMTASDTTDEALRLQLGWQDLLDGDDLFDAWLETPDGNTRLAQGNMLTSLDIAAVGFAMSGTESYIDSFTAAVPEPNSGIAVIAGLSSLAGLIRQRRKIQL